MGNPIIHEGGATVVEEKLEPEVASILALIEAGDNFLLSGGAGSGKTYSLVQVIREVIRLNPTEKVACMTFTNAAVREIEDRVNHDNLIVSTIHDFLWDVIKSFQRELKIVLIDLINDDSVTKITLPDTPILPSFFDDIEEGIQYKEWLRIKDGIISHDELLIIANAMFKKYHKLSSILKDKYKFIFIDEYQDTSKSVVEALLVHLQNSPRKNIIGFFGDSMQAIYDGGIGDLNEYRTEEQNLVKEVKKEQNRRNPLSVINLANQLRTDGIKQVPSEDSNAPNMQEGIVKQGDVKFLYSENDNLDEIRLSKHFDGWEFSNPKQTKELNLTHNLIAPRAGFATLMAIYDKDPVISFKYDLVGKIKDRSLEIDAEKTFDEVAIDLALVNRQRQLKRDVILSDPESAILYNQLKDLPFETVRKIYLDKDALIDDKKQDETDENKKGSKRDYLIKHLFKIQTLVHLYNNKKYNEFLKRTEFKVTSVQRKREIKQIIDDVEAMSNSSIEDVIEFAADKGICHKDERFTRFITENEYLYSRVKNVKFSEFQKLFDYLEGYTPFSTQHKIKGAEFDNVLVVLDNGGWNSKYNFANLFTGAGSVNVLSNTQKIFYVCCTRAKENLRVFYHNPTSDVLVKAIEWFGKDNVIKV